MGPAEQKRGLPEVLEAALAENPSAAARFDTLSPYQRAVWADLIRQAATTADAERRAQLLITALEGGRVG